jgi:hypothetical protein
MEMGETNYDFEVPAGSFAFPVVRPQYIEMKFRGWK